MVAWNLFRSVRLRNKLILKSGLNSIRNDKEYLLLERSYAQIWNNINRLFQKYVFIDDEIIKNCITENKNLNPLFQSLKGISIKEGYSIFYQYKGDFHGGKYNFTALNTTGNFIEPWQALQINHINEGIIELFYIIFEMPKHGVYWHGNYDLDYDFILSDTDLLYLIRDKEQKEFFSVKLKKLITIPTGLRIKKIQKNYHIKCLTYKTNIGIVDTNLKFDAGLSYLEKSEELLLKTSGQVFY